MQNRGPGHAVLLSGALVLAVLALGAAAPQVKGRYVMNGAEGGLAHVRAKQVELEKGKPGYVVLLSARPATGDIDAWRSGDPAKLGSFMYVMLEESGAIWVAELGHTGSKSGRFGVVMELKTSEFSTAGERLRARLRTSAEETFSENRYTIDVTFDAPLEH